jgi:hypothetical protein
MADSKISGAMALSVDEQGNFTIDHEPQGSRFTFSTSSHQISVKSYGTYVLTISTTFTLGDPAVTFPGGQPDDVELSDVGTNSFTLRIFASRESKDFPQQTNFEIHPADSEIDKIVDPTILVDPPRTEDDGVLDDFGSGTLLLSVDLDEPQGQFAYQVQVVDAPVLQWNQENSIASVLEYGTYYVVFGADFEFNDPAILFEGDPPSYVTLKQTGHLGILEIAVEKERQWPQTIRLRLNPKGANSGVVNEPTILVDPPRGTE